MRPADSPGGFNRRKLDNLGYAILDGQLVITDGLRLRIEATEAGPIW